MQATQAQESGLEAITVLTTNLSMHNLKPIIELEGTASQVELLLSLPNNGIALLQDSLNHWRENALATNDDRLVARLPTQ